VSRLRSLFQKAKWLEYDASAATVEVSPDGRRQASKLDELPIEEVGFCPESRIVYHTDPHGPAADRFRLLRMRLQELWNTGKLKKLLITSPLPSDGKSTIALNLATALSERAKRTVLLLEADLHRSQLTEQLGLEARPGLSQCLESGLNPMAVLRRLKPLDWYLLPAGKASRNPTELLQTEMLGVVMDQLTPHFDWILIDSPPVVPLTDTLSLRKYADASLLVARAGRTTQVAVEEALKLLGKQHVLGILLNGVEGLDRVYSKYGQYP